MDVEEYIINDMNNYKSERMKDFDKEFGNCKQNEQYWLEKSKQKYKNDLDKIYSQIEDLHNTYTELNNFRSKLKEVYNFTQMLGPVGLAKYQPFWTLEPKIWLINVCNINVDNVEEFIVKYPPSDYDLYFYDVFLSKTDGAKYTVRFCEIEKPHKTFERNYLFGAVQYDKIMEFKGDIKLDNIRKQFGF